MEERVTREIKIVKAEQKTTQDGKKFMTYKTVDKKGRLMDCKFRREVTNIPTEPCVLVVPDDMCSVDKNRQFPVLWIGEILEVKPYAQQASNLGEYFD